MLTEIEKKKIAKALAEKIGKPFECPICHSNNFTIIDGYLIQELQKNMNNIILGSGPILPSISIVCTKCGFMSQHNLGVLELIKPNESLNEI